VPALHVCLLHVARLFAPYCTITGEPRQSVVCLLSSSLVVSCHIEVRCSTGWKKQSYSGQFSGSWSIAVNLTEEGKRLRNVAVASPQSINFDSSILN
jgi:hypothetical protein